MQASDNHDTTDQAIAPRHWLRRIGWLLLIWCGSVAALGAVALGLRLVMRLIGMSPP